MQGRVSAGGDEPADRGHYLGREYGILGARPPVPCGLRAAEGADIRDGIPDGGGTAREPGRDRGVGCFHPDQRGDGRDDREGEIYPVVGAQGGEHRHGEELPVTLYRD